MRLRLWLGALTVMVWAAGCGVARHGTTQAHPCSRAIAPLPAPDATGAVRPVLEPYLTQYAEGWSLGDRASGLVVSLPPGCDSLADRIEARYGNAIHVERDVRIQPVK